MTETLKTLFWTISKCCGLFALARYVTRKRLRILCYHGFSLADEDAFRPGLFIKPETLQRRMQYLSDKGFPVLDLEQALTLQKQDALPACATIIVVDDGFYATYSQALKIWQQFSFPVTVYVTSYYVVHAHPIFRLAVQYMFWKTAKTTLNLKSLGIPNHHMSVTHADKATFERSMWNIIEYAEIKCSEEQRITLLADLGKLLEVDYAEIDRKRLFHLMTPSQIQEMVQNGVDIQLHTHRHHLPVDKEQLHREIADNREVLEPLVGKPLHHFCYPSGIWAEEHFSFLEAEDIRSATTCDPGLNDEETPLLALNRFLDGENISQIDFEAEMSGYKEILRQFKAYLLSKGNRGKQLTI